MIQMSKEMKIAGAAAGAGAVAFGINYFAKGKVPTYLLAFSVLVSIAVTTFHLEKQHHPTK